jgi:hypothetical protein
VRIAKHACLLACSPCPVAGVFLLIPGIRTRGFRTAFADQPCSTKRRRQLAFRSLHPRLSTSTPPPLLGPLPPPSLPPRELPCRRLLRTVTPPPRARSLPASSSSPVLPEKHSTARVSRPAALSTLRTGQSPQHELVQRSRRPRHVPVPPSPIPALSSRPRIACVFASKHSYTFLTH